MKYNVLILCDHSRHSDQNSIYALAREMLNHHQCSYIDVASRGLETNIGFYSHMDTDQLFGSRIGADFQYNKDGSYFKKGVKTLILDHYDIIFMRLPRPISDDWLLWLESNRGNKVVINNPKGIIKTSSKEYLLSIPEVCPPIKKIESIKEAIAFSSQHPIVLKPLREYGGKGIVKIDGLTAYEGEVAYERDTYLETLKDVMHHDGYIGMKYLKNVSQGDKRILVVGGDILAASLRLPPEGSWLCNVSQGGKSVPTEITQEEKDIIEKINPELAKEGILIYGIDTLVDDEGRRVLSEINTLSIGGFPQAQVHSGRPIIKQTIDKIFEYADDNK